MPYVGRPMPLRLTANRSICADFRCDVGSYRIIAAVDLESELFQVFGYSPVRVPEGARLAVAETIGRFVAEVETVAP